MNGSTSCSPPDETTRRSATTAPGSESLLGNPDFAIAPAQGPRGTERQDLPFDVGADLLFSNVRVNVEGDDDGRISACSCAWRRETQTFYVVKVDGAYRILAIAAQLGRSRQGAGAHRREGFRRRTALARLGAAGTAAVEYGRSARGPELRARLDGRCGDRRCGRAIRCGHVVSRQRHG